MKLRTLLIALASAASISGGATAAPRPFSLHIALHDHGFGFRNMGIRAAKVRLHVTNRGQHRHDLAVARRGTIGSRQSSVVVTTRSLAPGQTETLTLKLKPGRYRLYSKVDHDRAHGLSAPLVVMAPTLRDGAEMSRAFYNFY
jgi:uncharacterized cupredoxin-like copper-binding protein